MKDVEKRHRRRSHQPVGERGEDPILEYQKEVKEVRRKRGLESPFTPHRGEERRGRTIDEDPGHPTGRGSPEEQTKESKREKGAVRGVTSSEKRFTRSNGAEGSAEKTCGGSCPYGDGGGPKGQAQGQGKSFGQRGDSSKGGSSKGWSEKERSGSGRRRAISWKQGKDVALHTVAIGDLEVGLEKAFHYAQEVKVAGTLKKLDLEGGGINLFLKLSGTTGEEALKAHGTNPTELFQIHVCPPDCGRLETGERLLHGLRGRLLVPGVVKEDWMSNLVGAGVRAEGDELVALRERGALLAAADRVEPPKKKEVGSSSESKSKKKKKKKKKKEKVKKKTKESEEAGGEEKKKDSKRNLDGRHARIAVQKRPQVLFEGTGLDVKEKIRNRVMSRARKFVSKKRERSSSSSRSSSTSDSTEDQGSKAEGLYLEVNGQSCGRTIPRHPELRNFADDARQLADQPRRGQARHVSAAGSYTILSERNFEKGQRCVGPRNVDAGNSNRPRCEGPAGLGMRRVVSATEVVRKHGSRHNVADCAKNGDLPGRAVGHSSQGGASFSPERNVSGCKDQLPCKGQGKRKRERRKVRLQGGLQRRPRERQRERSRWKEGRQEEGGEIDEDGYGGRPLEDLGGPPGKEEGEEAVGERPGKGPDADLSPELLNGDHPGLLEEPVDEILGFSKVDSKPEACLTHAGTSQLSEEKMFIDGFQGSGDFSLGGMGEVLLQQLLEVFTSLRSKPTGSRNPLSVFPLPTSRSLLVSTFPHLTNVEVTWLLLVCLGLNSMWGGDSFYDGLVSGAQRSCLLETCKDVSRICSISGAVEAFDWSGFFRTRTVDYQGDEVKVARSFCWGNIAPALPEEIGRVPLSDICTSGCKYYVDHFDLFVNPRDQWPNIKKPKVMVSDPDWAEVCTGLVSAGVCRFVPREELFEGPDGPLLNGLPGDAEASKDVILTSWVLFWGPSCMF